MLNNEPRIKCRLDKRNTNSFKINKNITGLCSNVEENYNYLFKNISKKKINKNVKSKNDKLKNPLEEVKCYTISYDTNTTSKNNNINNVTNQNLTINQQSNQVSQIDNLENNLIYELKPLKNNNHTINICFSDNNINNLKPVPLNQLYNISSGIPSNKSTNCPSVKNVNLENQYYQIGKISSYKKPIDFINTKEFKISRKLLYSKSTKNKLLRDYVGSTSNIHCSTKDILKIEKNESEKNLKNNINTLKNWIGEIKEFDQQNNKKIEEKKKITSFIFKKVNSYEKQIRSTSQQHKKITDKKIKYNKEININEKKYKWNKKENENQVENIAKIKSEIEDLPYKIEKIKLLTLEYQQQIPIDKNEIEEINKKIKELNIEISKINKEKEEITRDITYYTKQIKNNKLKINHQFNKISTFMLNVNELVENIREQSKK